MACPRCGCHMLSRAEGGPWHRSTRLVCTRCNHPLVDRQEPGSALRLGPVLTLLALVLAGALVFGLSTLHDLRSPPPEPEQPEPVPEG